MVIYTKKNTCCFTGHRFYFSENSIEYQNLKSKLIQAIETAIESNYNFFISGMAIGFDMMAAETVLELKNKYPDIKLGCALPCRNQYKKWNQELTQKYLEICKQADYLTLVNDKEYFNGCMQARNKYMVDRSGRIISYFCGKPGGTKQTLDLAKKKGLEIEIIN